MISGIDPVSPHAVEKYPRTRGSWPSWVTILAGWLPAIGAGIWVLWVGAGFYTGTVRDLKYLMDTVPVLDKHVDTHVAGDAGNVERMNDLERRIATLEADARRAQQQRRAK